MARQSVIRFSPERFLLSDAKALAVNEVHQDRSGEARIILCEEVTAMEKQLTNREIEVLKWTAYGKTSREVSEILIISVNTVNFHVKNAMAKLQTVNKTATVARASVLGLLN
jgi:LuxR family transcriptional regulator